MQCTNSRVQCVRAPGLSSRMQQSTNNLCACLLSYISLYSSHPFTHSRTTRTLSLLLSSFHHKSQTHAFLLAPHNKSPRHAKHSTCEIRPNGTQPQTLECGVHSCALQTKSRYKHAAQKTRGISREVLCTAWRVVALTWSRWFRSWAAVWRVPARQSRWFDRASRSSPANRWTHGSRWGNK